MLVKFLATFAELFCEAIRECLRTAVRILLTKRLQILFSNQICENAYVFIYRLPLSFYFLHGKAGSL